MAGKQIPGASDDNGSGAADRSSGDVADRYRLLLELSPDAIAVHQLGVVAWVNSAALRFARVERYEDMVGRPITDYVHPDSLPDMLERLAGMGEQDGAFTGPDDVVMRDSRGDPRHMQITSVRTTWEGAPAYQVILRDITPLRRQAALVDHVSDAVISVGDDGTVRTWNPAAETIYGISSTDAIGMSLHTLQVMRDFYSPLAIVGVGGTVDALHRRVDTGQAFPVRQSVTQMDDGYLVVVQPSETSLVRSLGTALTSLHQAVILAEDSPEGSRITLANPPSRDCPRTQCAVHSWHSPRLVGTDVPWGRLTDRPLLTRRGNVQRRCG